MASATRARRRLSRPEREERMLEAAERVFTEHDFAAASMETIAAESGITKALLYQYFGSKEGLFVACVERRRHELFERVEAAAAAADGPAERVRVLVEIYLDDLQVRRGSPVVLYGDAPRAAVDEMRARNAEALGRVLRLDYPEAEDHAIELVAHLCVGAGEQIGRWWTAAEAPIEDVRRRFTRAIGMAVDAGLREGPVR